LIEGTYPINFKKEAFQTPPLDEKDESDHQPYNKIPFQQVQNQVAGIVEDHNPLWFKSHQEIFEKMTGGMFEMETMNQLLEQNYTRLLDFLGEI